MNSGVTIFLRAGDELAAGYACLESLAEHNRYKPVEVLLWANATEEAVVLVRPLLCRLPVRVLSTKNKDFARLASQVRYEKIIVVDYPFRIDANISALFNESSKAAHSTNIVLRDKRAFAEFLSNQTIKKPNKKSLKSNSAIADISAIKHDSRCSASIEIDISSDLKSVNIEFLNDISGAAKKFLLESNELEAEKSKFFAMEKSTFWRDFLDYKMNLASHDAKEFIFRH